MSEHEQRWHRWGIITHTKMTEKSYCEEVPIYLEKRGLKEKVVQQMSKQIDKISKGQLLKIAILFHDLGKFTVREIKENGINSNFITAVKELLISKAVVKIYLQIW